MALKTIGPWVSPPPLLHPPVLGLSRFLGKILERNPETYQVYFILSYINARKLYLQVPEETKYCRRILLPLGALIPQWALAIWHPAPTHKVQKHNQSSADSAGDAGGPSATLIPGTLPVGVASAARLHDSFSSGATKYTIFALHQYQYVRCGFDRLST